MLALALTPVSIEGAAYAQKEDALASARKLFAQALRDEEKGNFADALEKFQRVANVKDTVPVRYRIGTCLEGLGRLKDALNAYQAAIDLGAGDPKDLDVVRVAKEHTSTLAERIPQLTLTPSDHASSSSEVKVDGNPISSSELGKPIALDPGTHDVSASAPGAVPFQTQVTLAERARLSIVVPLDPKGAAEVPAPPTHPAHDSSASLRKTEGWIAVGIGAAFLVGAGVTLALRQSDISKLEDACPNDACPRSREGELSSVHSRAKAEGPIAAVLAGVGLIGVGVGTYFLLSTPHANHPPASGGTSRARGFGISGRIAPSGGEFVLTTTF